MIRLEILLLIIGMGIVTYIPRCVPVLVLSKVNLSNSAKKWMSFLPISIFASLLVKEVLYQDSTIYLSLSNYKLYVSIFVVALVMYKSKSIGLSIVLGSAVYLLI